MKTNQTHTFIQMNYQKQKPFSSFLPGIAGKDGIPMWSFYVNRGQLISSFGRQDKNGAILEFFPANAAYMYTKTIGFRTFIKLNGQVYEFFKEENLNQKLMVDRESVAISEHNESLGIKVTIKYFTLPNEPLGALVRKIIVENTQLEDRDIELLDGLTQILPSGIEYGGYKAISNLLQSWMDVAFEDKYAFYKLRASTGDSAEVSEVTDGNFFLPVSNESTPFVIADTKMIFEHDTSFAKPYGFIYKSAADLKKQSQVTVNQVPCAFALYDLKLKKTFEYAALIGYTSDLNILDQFSQTLDFKFIQNKEFENKALHDNLTDNIDVQTALPVFDAYLKQCYLDNLLRGGEPFDFKTKNQHVSYHLFSRKHGDLERDYNFFSIAPEFYSQGNGNFRDVLQNRRNDTWFHPFVKDHNLWHFASLIGADGYNPLSIEGLQFEYIGQVKYPGIEEILAKPFTPGKIYQALIQKGYEKSEAETMMFQIIEQTKPIIKASFGEGYWNDHFTYLYDLIEGYFDIYPETKDQVLFEDLRYKFFDSYTYVKPRVEKYVLTKDGKVRQYGALSHFKGKYDFLRHDGKEIEVSLVSKILTLVLNKYGILDPEGIGLSYEANKPGWNDAMNGLPGLFGSGVSEMFELKKLNHFLVEALENKTGDIKVLKPLVSLLEAFKANDKTGFERWDLRQTALETYRKTLLEDVSLANVSIDLVKSVLSMIESELIEASQKALKLGKVVPTYLTYEATDFEQIMANKEPLIGDYGLQLVKVKGFKMDILPAFLEAPARYLKQSTNKDEAKILYQAVKESELYDKKMKFYQTSESLDAFSNEIGRIRAFTKGWLERESNFLHMTYKYLLGLIKAGLYDEFYEELNTNLVCFMNPEIYGRSPLENSSFLATSTNPDPSKHGQGFVSRLSGSTAEMLSMYKEMFIGKKPFEMTKDGLILTFRPKLHKHFFKDGKASFKFYGQTVNYINPLGLNTYDEAAIITDIEVIDDEGSHWIKGSSIGLWASNVRQGNVRVINVFINREEAK